MLIIFRHFIVLFVFVLFFFVQVKGNFDYIISDCIAPFFDSNKEILHYSNMPFNQLDLNVEPYIDIEQIEKSINNFKNYVIILKNNGYNSIAIDDVNHLLLLDKLGIYKGTHYYKRNKQYLNYYNQIIKIANSEGLKVFIISDMQFYTKIVEDNIGKLSPNNPNLKKFNQVAFEELFENLSGIEGVIIRIGEGGKSYNTKDYLSKIIYKNPQEVNELLNYLIEIFEKYDKKLIFRTWTLGIGKIGDMIVNKKTYDQIFDGIDSDNFLVSIKYTPGDFFYFDELNPTIGHGNIKQIVEFQVRREYEGGGDYPNFIGNDFYDLLKKIKNKNLVIGIWNWNQMGGWGFGDRALFNFGFNFWNEINFFIVGKLLINNEININEELLKILSQYGFEGNKKELLFKIINDSREVIKKGWYIDEFRIKNFKFSKGISWGLPLFRLRWDSVTSSPIILSLIYLNTDNPYNVINQSNQSLETINSWLEERKKLPMETQLDNQILLSLQNQYKVFEILNLFKKSFYYYFMFGIKLNENILNTKIKEYELINNGNLFKFNFSEIKKFYKSNYWGNNVFYLFFINIISFVIYVILSYKYKKIDKCNYSKSNNNFLITLFQILLIIIIFVTSYYIIDKYNFYWIMMKLNFIIGIGFLFYIILIIKIFSQEKLICKNNIYKILLILFPIIVSLQIIFFVSLIWGEQMFWKMIGYILMKEKMIIYFSFLFIGYILSLIIFIVFFANLKQFFSIKKNIYLILSIGFVLFIVLVSFIDYKNIILMELSKKLYPEIFFTAGSDINEFF